jgi:hypothetical protein
MTCRVDPVDLLVVEGVGSGASSYASSITTLVWLEAPPALRLARGIAGRGAAPPQWLRFMCDEEDLFRRERTRERADLVVDGTSRLSGRLSGRRVRAAPGGPLAAP